MSIFVVTTPINMTRISAGVQPAELCDRMLIAEHREIKRIPNAIKNGKAVIKDIPKKFKLGTGHVKFFYDKLKYLHKRYNALREEAIERGFNLQDYNSAFTDLPQELYKDWEPCEECRDIVLQRIWERLEAMRPQDVKYYGEELGIEHFATIQ